MGYSLSKTPGVICDFLSIEHIVKAHSTNEKNECDFIVEVAEAVRGTTRGSNRCLCSRLPSTNSLGNEGCTGLQGSQEPPDSVMKADTTRDDLNGGHEKSGAETVTIGNGIATPTAYYLRAHTVSERNRWIKDINRAVSRFQAEREALKKEPSLIRCQRRIRAVQMSFEFQMATACVVALNFFVMVAQHWHSAVSCSPLLTSGSPLDFVPPLAASLPPPVTRSAANSNAPRVTDTHPH